MLVTFQIKLPLSNTTQAFFCAFGPKLRSSKNSGFRQNSGFSGQNSGIFPQKLRYSETFFSVYYIKFFKNSGQIGKTQVKVRKTQVFGNKVFVFVCKKCTKKKPDKLYPSKRNPKETSHNYVPSYVDFLEAK